MKCSGQPLHPGVRGLLAVLAGILLLGLVEVAPASADGPVAMITNLSGGAQVALSGNPQRSASVLDRLRVGDTLEVRGRGVCVLTFFRDGHREEVCGPARVRARQDGLDVLSGPPGAVRVKPVERAFVRNSQVVGMEHLGGDLARIQKTDLEKCSPQYSTLSATPEFRWHYRVSAPRCTVLLLADDGREVWRRTSETGRLSWPQDEEPPAPGRTWFWFPFAGEPPAQVNSRDFLSFQVLEPAAMKDYESLKARALSLQEDDQEDLTPMLLLWDRCCELNLLEEAWSLGSRLTTRLPEGSRFHAEMNDLRKILGIPAQTLVRPWDD